METIEFAETYKYDTMFVGITVPVALFDGAESSAFKAKIDTGSSFCIFERKNGERLGYRNRKRRRNSHQHGDRFFYGLRTRINDVCLGHRNLFKSLFR